MGAFAVGLALGAQPTGSLVYSTREWVGPYVSKDVPGGVETTPVRATLRIVAADGTGDRVLELPGARSEFPVSSPDGQWIYFQTRARGNWSIQRVHRDGSGLMTIAPGAVAAAADAYGLALAADGAHLTYTAKEADRTQVVLARADGSDARGIALDFGAAYMAAPDAQGKRVVFSGPGHGYRLAVAEATGPWRVLTPGHPDCYAPQFLPDGSAIIFIRRDGGLYRVAPDGTGLRRLAAGGQVEFFLSPGDAHGSTDFPAISPDGRQVAFVARDAAGVPNVWVVDADGANRRQVTRLPGACARARWSPDGGWLAFVSFVGDRPQLFVTAVDGATAPRRLTEGTGAVYALSWLPTPR